MSITSSSLTPSTAVITVSGRFDAHQVPKIQKDVDGMLANGTTTVVFDLSDVNFVDSSALAVMVRTMKHCRERGGELILCGLRQPVRIIFELTRMDKAFRIFDDMQQARNALGA
ncbi:MAG: STAS domain-containing protein [Caldilineaceae bacterium]|nr:STAS domain-containing protein [Caldilineaceae bacterium]